MATAIATSTTKRDFFLFHVMITFLLMFGVGFIEPIGTITPIGMKLLGIFFGVVYAWSTTTIIWPSILGIIAVGMSGVIPMTEFFRISIANDTVLFILFIMVFNGVIERVGLVSFLANWIISRKVFIGRPWLFTFGLLFGVFVCGTLVNEIAAVLMFWQIFSNIAKQIGFKSYSLYTTLMILGITFVGFTAAGSTLPFKLSPMIFLSTYSSIAGVEVNYGKYMMFSIPMALISVVVYTLIMRFIFRVDVSALKNLNSEFVDQSALKLDKRQKVTLVFLVAFIVLILAPDVLPNTWYMDQILTILTKAGTTMLLLVLMMIVKVEGKPLMDFQEVSASISWGIVLMFALILPLSSLITEDITGIKPFLVGMLSPLFSGLSPLVFAFMVLFSGFIITNFFNNAVLGIIYISIMCPLGNEMGINVFPIVALMVFTIQFAYLTPGGSAPAALVFSQTDLVKASDLFKVIPIMFFLMFLIIFLIGWPFAQLIL